MAKSKYKWIGQGERSAPEAPYETPVWLGNKSNGEFFHFQTERERKMRDEVLRRCDDNARKLGMDRREFIASSMGMLTTLSVFNLASGCADKEGFMSMSAADRFMAGQSGGVVPPSLAGAGGVAAPRQVNFHRRRGERWSASEQCWSSCSDELGWLWRHGERWVWQRWRGRLSRPPPGRRLRGPE